MSETAPEGTPPADDAKPPETTPPAPPAQETDWKAMARQWEKRAKDNSNAAEELEKLKASQMTDTEKAVDAARKEGEKTATGAGAKRLAKAEFKAAAAVAGVTLGDTEDLIDFGRFITDKGDVDEAEIKKAVKGLAKLAPKGPGQSGGDFGGGNGSAGQQDRPKSIREAYARQQK